MQLQRTMIIENPVIPLGTVLLNLRIDTPIANELLSHAYFSLNALWVHLPQHCHCPNSGHSGDETIAKTIQGALLLWTKGQRLHWPLCLPCIQNSIYPPVKYWLSVHSLFILSFINGKTESQAGLSSTCFWPTFLGQKWCVIKECKLKWMVA